LSAHRALRVPILTYHAMNVAGNAYGDNEHVALASDLATITRCGFSIVALPHLVDLWERGSAELDDRRVVALTCDDGSDFDYRDLPHPAWGVQRSFYNVLDDFRRESPGAQPSLSMTSFTIVSPQARALLDGTCLIGRGWWNDDWWRPATASGLFAIGSHAWDHNHDSLPDGGFAGVARGTFRTIDNDALADFQVAQATRYLREHAPNAGDALFAYPYGESNEFLERDYLPRRAAALGLKAALGDRPTPLTPESPRWHLPRYVCSRDWKSPEDLERLLRDAFGA
jgi:peptidoglycan/xylan/chitin deacetylase (PgdA/CDA1 family)